MLVSLWAWGQGLDVFAHRVGLQIKVIHLLQPRIFVRREHAIGVAHLGQHFAALENHMVFEGLKTNAKVRQRAAHLGVAGQGVGFVIVVDKHLLHAQLVGQARHLIGSHGVAHDQACARLPCHRV